MGHPLRLDPADGHHHVYNRGAGSSAIFLDDEDCLCFLGLLSELPGRYGVEVHGYALMSNHFHLLLVSRKGRLAHGMQRLQAEYAARHNLRHGLAGPLYDGRYQSRLVEDDTWWAHLLAYVHLNPVAAHLVKDPAEARWTSHAAYIGQDRAPPWLSREELLETFGGPAAIDAYVRDVQRGREPGPEGFEPESWEGGAAGSREARPRPPAEPPRRALVGVEEALMEVAAVTGLAPASLARGRRGRRGSPERWVAMAWLVERAGLTQAAAARRLGTSPVVACRDLARLRRQEGEDGEIGRWMSTLRGIVVG